MHTQQVLATVSYPDFQRIRFLDDSLEAALEKLVQEAGGRPAKIEMLSSDSLNRRFIIRIRSPKLGYATFLLHTDGTIDQLDGSETGRSDGDEIVYVAPKPVQIDRNEGPAIKALLTTPVHKPGPFPSVIMIHGGPLYQYHWTMHPLVQRLASTGIAVIQVNYRGSSGYGREYADHILIGNRPFESTGRDVEAVYDWLVATGLAIPGKTGLWGDSFGAPVAVQVAAEAPIRYPAVVLGGGLFDFQNFINSLLKGGVREKLTISVWKRYMGTKDVTELLSKGAHINPCNLAEGLKSSTLIFAGELDPVVHPEQSIRLHDELVARGTKTHLWILGGERHSIASRKHVMLNFAQSADFYYKYLVQGSEPNLDISNASQDNSGSRMGKCLSQARSLRELRDEGA